MWSAQSLGQLDEAHPVLSRQLHSNQVPSEPETDSGAEESETETESEGGDDEEDTVRYNVFRTTGRSG